MEQVKVINLLIDNVSMTEVLRVQVQHDPKFAHFYLVENPEFLWLLALQKLNLYTNPHANVAQITGRVVLKSTVRR